MKKIFVIFLAIFLISCTTLDGIKPTKLSKPQKETAFILDKDVIGEMIVTNGFGVKTKTIKGLYKGKYMSVFADKEGTYYQGPKDCVYFSKDQNIDGGIWMPKKGSIEEPRLWIYIQPVKGTYPQYGGPLAVTLANIPVGNVRKEWYLTVESSLLNEIHIQD